MNLMTRDDFKELLVRKGSLSVTLFMPAAKAGDAKRQNPILFRKLLRDTQKQLAAMGHKPAESARLLAPALPLVEERKFWRYQSGGLALFLSSEIKRVYTLPLNFREMTLVSDHFCVTPLLPFFAEDGRFYVLALSQSGVRFYQCSRHSIAEVDLQKVPKNISELLELNPREKQLQFHANTEGRTGASRRSETFHGSAQDSDESKTNILTFFQHVNRGVMSMLKKDGAPLVTAGVEYLTRIYDEANSYPNLMECSVTGAIQAMKPEELRDQAWELLKPRFDGEALEAVKLYEQLLGTPRVSSHIREILQAAFTGRVSILLVSTNAQRWGMFDQFSGELDLHRSKELWDTELVDLCVTRTLTHGGKVFVLGQAKMPGTSPLAAVFGY